MTTRIISITSILLLLSFSVFSQNIEPKVNHLLDSVSKEYPELGLTVGILKDGDQKFYNRGKLSREKNASKVNSETVFELASITKALTGNLAAQAALDGKLQLDDYIDSYLPRGYQLKPALQNKVKISDLASHQSGLVDINFRELITNNPQQPTSVVTKEMIMSMVNNTDSLTNYGAYRYSTLGLVLLGQIIEEVYQKPYEELVQEKLIDELGLKRTFLKNYNTDNIAMSYNMEGGHQELFEWGVVAPAGLIKSSASDMLLYLNGLLDNNSIVGKAARLQEKSYYTNENREVGLGQNIMKVGAKTIYGKTGDTLGQTSVIAYSREDNWGIVLLMNQSNGRLKSQLFKMLIEMM